MKTSARLAFVLLFILTANAIAQVTPQNSIAGPPSDWIEFVSSEGRFTVLMPGKPAEDPLPNALGDGSSKPHRFFITTKDRQYFVSYENLRGPISAPADREGIFNSACKKLEGDNAKLTGTKDIFSGNDPGFECKLDVVDGIEVMRLFLSGLRLFSVMTVTSGSKVLSRDSIRFLESFSINSGVGSGLPGDYSDGGTANSQKMQILNAPRPDYTQNARDHGIEGVVIVQALFKADGTITDMKVVRGLGYGLDEQALKAVGKIKFSPAMRNGKKVDFRGTIRVSFALLKRQP